MASSAPGRHLTRRSPINIIKATIAAAFGLIVIAGLAGVAPPAMAQNGPPERIRGAIESVDGQILIVRARDGDMVRVDLEDAYRVIGLIDTDLDGIQSGSFIGTAALPHLADQRREFRRIDTQYNFGGPKPAFDFARREPLAGARRTLGFTHPLAGHRGNSSHLQANRVRKYPEPPAAADPAATAPRSR